MEKAQQTLLPIEEAWAQIKQHVPAFKLKSEQVPISEACGRYISQPVHAMCDVPPAPNSAMDGFALNLDDFAGNGAALPVQSKHFAGQPAPTLEKGKVIRIFTGADLPIGANAVVAQESCDYDDRNVTINCDLKVGQNIRPQGQDIKTSDVLFEAGHKLKPQDIGVLASVGIAQVAVFKPLKIGLISTGDELVAPGHSLASGQIYNSNQYALQALLTSFGFEVTAVTLATDDVETLTSKMLAVASMVDIVVSSGGVSVGEADYVKQVLENNGQQFVWKLALKPGKPLVYGQLKNKPFFGLPGNPVAAYVTALIFLRAYKNLLIQSEQSLLPAPIVAKANFTITTKKRREMLRGKLGTDNEVSLYTNQSSGVLSSLSTSNCLIDVPANTEINTGDDIHIYLLDSLIQS